MGTHQLALSWSLCHAQGSKHYQYLSWPNHGVPTGPAGVLGFLEEVNWAQRTAPGAGGPTAVTAGATGERGAGPRGTGATGGGARPHGHCRSNPGQGHGFVLRIAAGIQVGPHSAGIGRGGTVVVIDILVGVIQRQGEPQLPT